MRRKKVSVIIPTYNGEDYIRRSLNSLINQTFQNFEIVVVDDGSTDDTAQIIQNFTTDIQIKICPKKDNSGFTAAMNTGIMHAEGEFIAFQGQDDFSVPTRIEKQAEILEENSSIEMVHSPAKLVDQSGKVMGIEFRNKNPAGINETFFELYRNGMHIAAPSIMMKKRHFNKMPASQKWGRPQIRICSDYEHSLHVAHDYRIYGIDEPLVKMLRGEEHKYASRHLKRNLEENVKMLEYIRDYYSNCPPVVDHPTYQTAISNQYTKYGHSLMLQGRFAEGAQLLAKGFRRKPLNPYWYKKVLSGLQEAIDYYTK